jgi:uncharacterized protein
MARAPSAEIVINGDDVYEDLLGTAATLQELASSVGFATTKGIGMWRFLDARAKPAPDVYVLYTATGAFSEDEQRGLVSRVRAGTGLLALHASNVFATAKSGQGDDHKLVYDLIGSRFSSHGLPPHESRFWVKFDRAHAITHGLADFEVTHEHYVIELADPAVEVLAVRQAAEGPEPLLYVRHDGKGRVCYLQLGHDMRVWDEPRVRTLLGRTLWWCAGERHPHAKRFSGPERL